MEDWLKVDDGIDIAKEECICHLSAGPGTQILVTHAKAEDREDRELLIELFDKGIDKGTISVRPVGSREYYANRWAGERAVPFQILIESGEGRLMQRMVQTLPEQTKEGKLKGDHQENAFLVTINIDYEINQPQDVFYAIRQEVVNSP